MSYLSRIIRAALLATIALGLCSAVAFASDGASFNIRPAHPDPSQPATQASFFLSTTPGSVLHDEVLVRNSGTAAGQVRLYAVDGGTGSNSGIVYRSDDEPRKDVAAWLVLGEQALTLGPGEERTVPFTVTIPADAMAGQHLGGIVAESLVPAPSAQGSLVQINTRTRMVAPVQVVLPGAVVEQVSVTGVTAGGTQGEQTILLGLRNDGTERVKPLGTLVVTTAQGQEVQRLPFQLDSVLPRTEIQYPVAVQRQALGAGAYSARVELTYGKGGSTNYKGDFSITSAQVAQVFPPQGAAQPLAPPSVLNPAQVVDPAPSPTTTIRSLHQAWSTIAGVLLVIVLLANLALFWRLRAKRRA